MSLASPSARAVRGFSIVELMVAITLGLIVLAGLSTVFMNSKINYVSQESAARLQENARVALQFILKDLRLAGYYGCVDDLASIRNTISDGNASDQTFDAVGLEGFEGGMLYPSNTSLTLDQQVSGTDAFVVRMADRSDAIKLTKEMPNASAALHSTSGNSLKKGDIVMVTDCDGAAIFQITGPDDPSGGTLNHNTGASGVSPGNETKNLGRSFDERAEILKFVSRIYYVKNKDGGRVALVRQDLDPDGNLVGTPEEIVEGISGLQLRYGRDTDGDGVPNIYVDANDSTLGATQANWTRVKAVRIEITADPVDDSSQRVTKKDFTSTVLLRNL